MWIYQQVLNVGIQVLVLIGLGYLFARFKLLEQAKFLPQCNFIVLMLALPAFNLYLMGIKLDLQSPDPWKSLAAFLLWVFVVQLFTVLYTWRCCGGDAGEAAVVNMVLLMDNYAITGLLALNATLGTKWGTLALLMAMGFFLVIFPFSLAAFEWEKWAVQQHVEAVAEAAAADIEAATAVAAEMEAKVAADKSAKAHPDGPGLGTTASPGASDAETQMARPPQSSGPNGPQGNGVADAATLHHDFSAVELTLYPGTAPSSLAPPSGIPADGTASRLAGGDTDGALAGAAAEAKQGGQSENGFPHESRYCWWSNEDYRPAHPLLVGDAFQSSQTVQQSAPPKSQRQRRRRQEMLQEQLLRQAGTYVPPQLPPQSSDHPGNPTASPFESSAAVPWTGDGAVTSMEVGAGGGAWPGTAPPSAVRRPATIGTARSAQSPRWAQAEARSSSMLAAMFDKLAAAGSGQLPPAMLGDLDRAVPGAVRPEPEKPVRLQDLEFALTHQLSGGTASQLARISRSYTAAAAAATAAATSPDANVRRLLLGATGTPTAGRSPLASTFAREASGPAVPRTTVSALAPAPGPVGAGSGIRIPTRDVSRRGGPSQPPLSASSGAAFSVIGGTVAGSGAVGSPQSAVPTALASLESGDSIGPPAGDFLHPAFQVDAENVAADAHKGVARPDDEEVLACPTLTRQGVLSAAQPQLPVSAPASEGRLATTSTPMFSFGQRSQRRLTVAPGPGAGGADAGGGSPPSGPPRRKMVHRSASDTAGIDRTLLTLASGLALESAKRRRIIGGDRTPLPLVDTDTNVMLQLANALSGREISDLGTVTAADKQLVREATKEALRRHGGVAKACAAFVSGHPQLWHIIRTLAKNPMIWTIFIAMAVSVSGLRVFLDPASPDYRPEVGWVAGSLSWLNGLVVPMSLFSNGAWMYGKPLLPKGEVIKMLVLLFIKLGVLPLLMTGCAMLVQLDGQHVAAMTVLTLSPAAAASFVLAVQYGRGVELVSLTNIIGNIFLTPLIVMWLKVLAALNISFTLHEDV